MKKVSASQFFAILTLTLLVLSFGFGYGNYSKTERKVISALNCALQQTISQHSSVWLCQDSLQHYSKLQSIWDSPISINSCNRYFAEILSIPQLKESSGILIHIVKVGEEANIKKELPDSYAISDTILCISPTNEQTTANTLPTGISLSFRGYSNCPAGTILLLSNPTLPLLLFLSALLSGFAAFRLRHKHKVLPNLVPAKSMTVFGNLSYCNEENCFYNEQQERLRLTPLQLSLMEMFYQSPSHLLVKTDINSTLWPGKENADETLYTLIRRLKPIIEENSNLRIISDRGRAYALEVVL